MAGLYKKIRRGIFVTTYIFLLLFFLWRVLFKPLLDFLPFGPIYTDVAKRIESPDRTKTALLIRRYAFDLNFILKIKEDSKTTTLFYSKDFFPDRSVDWKEQLIWSDDSSFLVMTVEEPPDSLLNRRSQVEKYMWAYDFKNNKEYETSYNEFFLNYHDVSTIINILNSRSKEKKMDLIEP